MQKLKIGTKITGPLGLYTVKEIEFVENPFEGHGVWETQITFTSYNGPEREFTVEGSKIAKMFTDGVIEVVEG